MLEKWMIMMMMMIALCPNIYRMFCMLFFFSYYFLFSVVVFLWADVSAHVLWPWCVYADYNNNPEMVQIR